jgi:tetratricopeptide (TPR) repeat protein
MTSPAKLAFDRKMSEGALAMRQGNYEKAVEALSEATRLMPQDARAQQSLRQARYQLHMNRGAYLFNLRRYDEAVKEFEAALEAVPGDLRAQASLKDARGRVFLRKLNNKKD